ncbi:2-oxo-4-hydroxy-4-carboxy-5-ureidoimidazoline decarboxylase [Streptomyces jietaisiensis]|uniref:2-oxo-4-hydroxy-4-carboxy-5-ureidoimidazoline decarboxylase n=3 Tax=Streptomyces TaxID=1883 RepID=A0ABZ1V037_9ACTN|nr:MULTISPECIES: 2-oxo-4-hydroxy-4-carboxy-5-ureidoimidazoline decarboxylase [Streptomyces]MBA5225141.1 2-oxo-4-hydroxy-4-carboxy-5-ureidoimidazoline decarboxylase [Streptomyces griseoaurantiacus]MDX3363279.1 2-oxo-4-hydroxy-4-carboxy-5-ureidoimidazoline decarboxylase [Streptomyces sp. ME02-6978.2a]
MMSLLSPHPQPIHTPRAHDTAAPPRRGPTLPAHRPHLTPDPHAFNTAPADEAERALLSCCRSPRWARRVAAHRPYPDLPALLAAADEAAYDLAPADLAEALAGESLTLLPDGAYSAAQTALSAAHAAYESRFGHVFVICLDDVAPDEAADRVLAGIRSRWNNDPEDERVAAAEELRRLARGRLTRLLGGYAAATDGIAPQSPGSERPSRPYVPH